MLEFRFSVHEYLKGTGPAEIGGNRVHVSTRRRPKPRLAAARIAAAHDSRWDSREAIVFLYSPSKEAVQAVHFEDFGAALPTSPDQFLFGRMIEKCDPIEYRKPTRWQVSTVSCGFLLLESPSQGASGATAEFEQQPSDPRQQAVPA